MASGCKLPIFPWWPLQTHRRRYLQNPFKFNVNGQSSATREVRLAIKKTAHKQPKDVNGGVLAAVHRGFLSSFSLGAFATQLNLILPAFQPFSIACNGNSVSWPFFQAIALYCPFAIRASLSLTLLPIILTWPLAALFSVDSYASLCLRATTKTPQETLNESCFIYLFIYCNGCDICTPS